MIWTEKAWARTNELIAEHLANERISEAVALKAMRESWRELGASDKFTYGYRLPIRNPDVAPENQMFLGFKRGEVKFIRTAVGGRSGWTCEETGFVFLDEHEGLEFGIVLDLLKKERWQSE